ncbi:MAG: polysaccharide export protein [Acidobacteriia bacterium]|nr:polysaccharide export protein [Terriglobia bacterium]
MPSLRWISSRMLSLAALATLAALLATAVAAQQQPANAEPKPASPEEQTATPATKPAPTPGDTGEASGGDNRSDSSLRLGVGDLLEVSVYGVPELSTKTRVSSNGDVYLPLVDYVHVAGLTAEEAQGVIEKRLEDGGFLKTPHVTLFVDEYASQGASVLGEVAKPGVYPVLGQQRLFDLISAAGGFTERAGRSVTVTRRSQPDKPVTVPIARNLTDNPDSNIDVFPGDTVIVRKADIVYVVGDVGRPTGLLMDNGNMTVLQAIALAGGTTKTAKLSGTAIIRKGATGMTQTPVHLKQMLAAKAPDVPLQADDILFIPTSTGKVVAGRTLEAAIQAASALSIVAIRP